ncbi:MAG: hypothetical protein KGK16_17570 [Bradyrhizobium sp.]|uniref:hypothetical protein n=1 Tax=Bradyrhizobium sp. TaxID=376 RepID=UPI001EBFF4A0|nr:hypothetical protein [Bradyrhizobium sp.]MBU6456637.1 hypothetical protein [Bradyrhizobium sp.]MDE2332573.1 hypothetical protein [Bradyrhizobium sp.]MDE2602175.1 hypothetical protein [Bradyrhizobium sp.]
MVKPTLAAGRTTDCALSGLSKTAFGLGSLFALGDSGIGTSAASSGRTALRRFDDLSHFTQPPPHLAVLIDGFVIARSN